MCPPATALRCRGPFPGHCSPPRPSGTAAGCGVQFRSCVRRPPHCGVVGHSRGTVAPHAPVAPPLGVVSPIVRSHTTPAAGATHPRGAWASTAPPPAAQCATVALSILTRFFAVPRHRRSAPVWASSGSSAPACGAMLRSGALSRARYIPFSRAVPASAPLLSGVVGPRQPCTHVTSQTHKPRPLRLPSAAWQHWVPGPGSLSGPACGWLASHWPSPAHSPSPHPAQPPGVSQHGRVGATHAWSACASQTPPSRAPGPHQASPRVSAPAHACPPPSHLAS